jgi:hypothetical protein
MGSRKSGITLILSEGLHIPGLRVSPNTFLRSQCASMITAASVLVIASYIHPEIEGNK